MNKYQIEAEKRRKDWKWVKISFSVLFLLVALILGKLWYDGIFFFGFESKRMHAEILEVTWHPVRGVMDIQYIQAVHYSYEYDDSTFDGYQNAGVSMGRVFAGDSIEIEVLVRKPSISRFYEE